VAPRVMTDFERADIVVRLVAMQQALRGVCEGAEAAAALAKEAGASGLAMATLLMKESIEGYGKALNRFVLGEVDDE
jgi:hypothetical protein